ncbi:unnamed protein product [Orchesella dallaii]|uniref:Integrase catalytic domain-containing protein n=1 Tax=Orchesella dallaii TaxID=48710 RepID=A0ABP1RVZ5_9HEXA
MLDYGSQASLITERCANALGLKRRWDRTTITGIGMGEVGHTKGKISVKISSMTNDESVEIEALVMKKVTGDIPNYPCEKDWEHLAGVNLADPSYYRPGPVDILLGAEYTTSILRDGRIEGERHSPTAQNTIFGWVLAGRVTLQESKQIKIHHVQCETELIMKRFWELEEIPDPKQYTQDEKFCEEHFLRTHWKDETGRFGVQLPVKENISKLGYSRQQAINRLNQVERRLLRQPEFRLEYNNFMNEYIKLGHMQRIPRGEVTERLGETYYLPHHFVIKPDSTSTKFRVVFDASAKTTTGLSLNDCLGVGKSHQDDIFTLLLKFREHKIVIKADIAKMFRQFNVSDEHADLQRIVWRNSAEDQIEDYKLTTVTYGTASAPFTAVRCLQQLATENKLEHPVAASKLEEDLYVDDLMSGAESSEEAISIVDDLTKITATAGLSLRKWTSNSEDVLAAIPVELRETQLPLSFEKEAKMKALGVQWNPSTDNFSFSELQYQQVSKITKRVVLSQLAKVFDPLGFISPVTIRAKLFLQELWKSELSWDESLTDDMCNRWLSYRESLSKIEELQIPRWVKTSQLTTVQLHGFGDSSLKAYGAVVYLRCENEDGSFSCKMLAAKSKVAPLQTVSLPRLEICAAVLTAQLVTTVKKALKLECEVFAWSDSMITLQWLSAYPGRWDTFVANRVSIIQELIPAVQWNHVKTEDNPADVLSRGISAEELCNNNQWWHGPSWLSTPNLPERSSIKITTNVEEKKRRVIVAHTQTVEAIIQKYSSLQKLKRILVYLLRFIDHYVKKQPIKTGAILPSELNRSMMMIVRSVQHSYFSTELKLLQKDKPVQPSSKLNTLTPFLDIDDVVRVTGRLSNADISYNQKYPMVLPSGSHLTKLLIEDAHLALLHGGVKLLWCHLRLNYWILSGKNTIRFFVRKCVVCIRNRAEKMEQLMGSLPSSRVNITHAFLHSGVDYAGPFNLRVMKGRSNKLFKGYFAIFVCMATKAIHLEAVIDMTTEAFLAALRRFVSRRGVPAVLYSDCGTNFTGADKELKQFLRDDEHNRAVTDDLSGRGIEWKFNPPSSPHHGGLWEAGVKSVKYHLRRVVGNHTLTFEEFATILCQVEACLNSRPLCAISDPEDVEVLTPGHFLTGQALTAIPHPDVSSIKTNRLSRWQYTQQVLQHFWKQWRMEYLSSLQQRFKWKRKCENIKVGDIVIIHEDNVPPMKWKLAKVIEVHGGADDRVRVVSVKTSSGIYKRPIVKLTPILSIDE